VRRALLLAAAAILLAGCGSGDDAPAGEPIGVENGVVGETPAGADAAVYLDIVGGAGDALVGASSPLAAATSLHTMEPVEGGGIMYPTDRIDLEGDVTALAPIDKHVMLEGLADDLVEGDTVTVTLNFEDHVDIDVEVDVVPLADLAELLPDE
jgi:copper(I)-binding protein